MTQAHAHSHNFEVKKLDRLSATRVRMTVELDAASVQEEEMRVARRYLQQAKFPGFRPGKAPMDLVFRQYEKEILKDSMSHLLEHCFAEACEKNKIIPVGEPKIEFGNRKLREAAPFQFEAEFDVRPEIDLKHYKGIPVRSASGEVAEDEITKAIDDLRDRRADLEPTDDKNAKRGHFAILELGYKLVDGTKEQKPEVLTVEIGSGRLLDEIESALDGLAVGEETTVKAKFPKESDPSVSGKDAEFSLKITELKKKKLPEFDDAFAATLRDGATAEIIRNEIKDRIAQTKKRSEERAERDQVVEYLVTKHEFEAPKSLVEQEVARMLQSAGVKPEEMPTKLPKDQLAQVTKRAEMSVRGSLLLAAVAEKEELDVEDEEVRKRIAGIAAELKRPIRETVMWLEERGMLRQLRDELLTDRVFAFLLEHAERLPHAP